MRGGKRVKRDFNAPREGGPMLKPSSVKAVTPTEIQPEEVAV